MVPVSHDAVEVDFDSGHARLRLRGLDVFDDHDLANSLTQGLGIPSAPFNQPGVFPVRAKQPLTARGVYSATSDLDLLARMDGWRNADGCGLATGDVSGVDVLDVDVRDCALSLVDRESSSPHHDGGGANCRSSRLAQGNGAG